MNSDYAKALIQEALWNEFKKSNDDDYKKVYTLWYSKFEDIDLDFLFKK